MQLENYVDLMRPAIEKDMQNALEKFRSKQTEGLFEMLSYHLGWEGLNTGQKSEGKRVRPLLVLLSALSVGGKWESALPAATAVELVHNFSLIHDDIQDNSSLRRGRETVWKKWGKPQAINTGDAMFALSHMALDNLDSRIPISITCDAQKILPNACFVLTQGQFLDISYEDRNDLTLDDYWPMITGKTAYLISTCTELGALIGGATKEMQTKYKSFGKYIGLAFQVYDDFLGIWGNSTVTGKSVASDLISGKKSYPVLFGLAKNGEFAKRWKQGAISKNEVDYLANLLKDEGAYEDTKNKAEELTRIAIDVFDKADIDSDAGKALLKLSQKLIHRED